MKHGRIIALDYGDVRIGIAMTDELQTIASPIETYKRKNNIEDDLNYLENFIKKNDVVKIVIGMPYNMDGSESDRAIKTKNFGEKLKEKCNLEILYIDERLTSVEAEEILIQSGMKRQQRKENIDKIAASLILENYLNRKTY